MDDLKTLYDSILHGIQIGLNQALNENISENSNDFLLHQYGIDIFTINEDFSESLQNFKQGVVNAINKLNAKIGSNGGYFIKHIIDEAKSHGRTALIAALTMLNIFGGVQSVDAKMSEIQKQYFVEGCEQIYKGNYFKKYQRVKSEITTETREDHRNSYCIGFSSEDSNYQKAYQKAKENAIERIRVENQKLGKRIKNTDHLEIVYVLRSKENNIWKVMVVARPHANLCGWQQNNIYELPITF